MMNLPEFIKMQGGILSPLLSNVHLNDFDWFVGRMYMEPHRKCKHKCNDTLRLKWFGITMVFITHSKYEIKPYGLRMMQ